MILLTIIFFILVLLSIFFNWDEEIFFICMLIFAVSFIKADIVGHLLFMMEH